MSAVRVALDAMGGDFGPQATVPGAVLALERHEDLVIRCVGDRQAIERALSGCRLKDPGRLSILPSDKVLPDGGHPAHTLRANPDVPVALATRQVAGGEADAVVSMGHTGASMISARWWLGLMPGVRRPAPAGTLPIGGEPLFMDLGANPQATAKDLVAFAALGHVYAKRLLGIAQPRVALLCNGVEEGKGTPVIQAAHDMLKRSSLPYAGYIEPLGVPFDVADVVVADGFTGNIFIKWLEGISTYLVAELEAGRLGPSSPVLLDRLGKMRDVTQGGRHVMLLGVNGVMVPGHGRADVHGVADGIEDAYQAVRAGILSGMQHELSQLDLD